MLKPFNDDEEFRQNVEMRMKEYRRMNIKKIEKRTSWPDVIKLEKMNKEYMMEKKSIKVQNLFFNSF